MTRLLPFWMMVFWLSFFSISVFAFQNPCTDLPTTNFSSGFIFPAFPFVGQLPIKFNYQAYYVQTVANSNCLIGPVDATHTFFSSSISATCNPDTNPNCVKLYSSKTFLANCSGAR